MNYTSYFAIEKKIKAQGFEFERAELIRQFSSDKKEGLTELTATEYREFILWLNRTFPSTNPPTPQDERLQRQRRKVIALLAKVGYVTSTNKSDMTRINAWVERSGYLHKPLNRYTLSEISKLVYQAEQVYKTHIDRL